jgi:hypothetical protein
MPSPSDVVIESLSGVSALSLPGAGIVVSGQSRSLGAANRIVITKPPPNWRPR